LSDDRPEWVPQNFTPAGIYVLWQEFDSVNNAYPLFAQWFQNGKQWGDNGVQVAGNVGSHFSTSSHAYIEAAKNGDDGLLVSWHYKSLSVSGLSVQRVNNDGSRPWGPAGVLVLDQDAVGGNWPVASNYQTTLTADGSSGAILAWTDWRHSGPDYAEKDVYAQRVASNGSLLWVNDVLLSLYVTGDSDNPAPGSQRSPAAAADGNGGALVALTDFYYGDGTVILTRVSDEGMVLFADAPIFDWGIDQDSPQIVFDQSGGAYAGAIVAFQTTGDNVAKVEIDNDPPVNDACADATTIGIGNHTGTLARATNDGESSCNYNSGQPDVWYRFVAPNAGEFLINTCGTHDMRGIDAGMDTIISVHQEVCPATNENELACNDDAFISNTCGGEDLGYGRDSALTLQLAEGDAVLIRVSRYYGIPSGNFKLQVSQICIDVDGDGFGVYGASSCPGGTQPDCNDDNSNIHPGVPEICDGIDNDCNPATPDGSGESWYGISCDGPDSDFCEEGVLACSGGVQTCSDTSGDDIEICDGLDNDCNGLVDDGISCNTPPSSEPQTIISDDGKVDVTFDEVTEGGETTFTNTFCTDYRLWPSADICVDIDTTATFEGPVEICFNYGESQVKDENNLRMVHCDDNGLNCEQITPFTLDTVNNIICAEVDHFSILSIGDFNPADLDADNDVDGKDLQLFTVNPNGIDLGFLAGQFGTVIEE